MALLGALIGGAASLFGANKAASSQLKATRESNALMRDFRDEDAANAAPYLQAGVPALNAVNYNLGIGERPEGYEGYSMTPAANYMLTMGRDATEAGAAGRGNLFSGATASALDAQRMGIVNQDYNNYMNRLTGMANMGQAAAAGQAQSNQYYGGQMANNISAAGNANASRYIASGNIVNDTIGNINQIYGYANGLS